MDERGGNGLTVRVRLVTLKYSGRVYVDRSSIICVVNTDRYADRQSYRRSQYMKIHGL